MSDITAQWHISLDTDCPHCEESIDLLEDPDFLVNCDFQLGEHDTKNTKEVSVWCPICWKMFTVDFTY